MTPGPRETRGASWKIPPGVRSARRLARIDTFDSSRPDQPPGVPDTLAVLFSGVAFMLAFPLPDLGFVAWVALVPLFVAAHHRSPRTAFWLGYVWGVVAYGGVLWWTTAFGPAVWALLVLLGAAFPALAMLATAWVERDHDGPLIFLWVPLIWTAVEFLRSQGPLGFPWALLGATQHQSLAVIQIASVTGIYGVSFLVALVNAALYVLLTRRVIIAPIIGTGLLVLGAVLWGTIALRQPTLPGTVAALTAAVVQPNLGLRTRESPDLIRHDFAVLDALTQTAALRGATLVVWPETAAPTDILDNPATLATIRSWVQRDRISLIASSLEGGRANSAFAFAPSGKLTGRYDKMRLVPFAEFGESAGRGRGVLATPDTRIGMAICFESIFPGIARRAVRQGATLLAVITNDAWFDGRTAPAQHAALAPFRAVEEGRYLLRAANSGISAVIDPRGRTLAELPLGARGVLTARVAPRSDLTPYARFGDAFGWASVLFAVGLLVPRALAFAEEEAGTGEFSRLLLVSALPLAGLGAGEWWARGASHSGPGLIPLPIVAVLLISAWLSVGRPPRELGFQLKGFAPAALSGLVLVGVLGSVARSAFASHGPAPQLVPPPGGWWWGTAIQVLVVGLGLEWWLRGLVFSAADQWRGWRVAVLWSALLGTLAASPRGAESMVWALCSGLGFGLIRARWAQVPALGLAHGVGNVLLGFLLSPW